MGCSCLQDPELGKVIKNLLGCLDITKGSQPEKRIAYIAPTVPTPEAIENCKKIKSELPESFDFQGLSSLQELFYRMSNQYWHADFVVIDVQECYKVDGVNIWELIGSLKTLSRLQEKFNNKSPTHIIAGIPDTTPVHLVREALKCKDFSGYNPIIGGRHTYEICLDSVKKYTQHDWTIPRSIKDMIKPKKEKKPKSPSTGLTYRQQQIYKLLMTRGSSNKQIANTLKISESTVKLHMSAILKKHGCRNRTQLTLSKVLA